MTDARIGELAGLATAALWVVSSLSFTAAGRRLGATRVNLLRTLGAAVVLACVQWLWFGQWMPRTETAATVWLACSGLLGLTIGDQFLFTGYVMLGPRTVSLLMTLSPSLAATIAWIGFGEHMSPLSVLGMLITTGGVAWVTLGRQQVVSDRDARTIRKGLLFGLAAAVCQALGMVMARRGLVNGVDAFDAQTIRMYAGAASVIPVALYAQRSGRLAPAQASSRALGVLAIGTVSGPLLGVYCSMVAVKMVGVGVASTLIGLVPVLILPASWIIDRQRISTRAWIGAIIAVVGIALLAMGSGPPER